MSTENDPPMKSPPTFQIKVALIGNVSAGKTTVVNALFRDKYGEVSMKRTTAGVNEFAVCSRTEWALIADEPRDSHSVLKEITQDNVELRASDEVNTKRFEIELEEALCEMRKDTQLVIVDIPGINEANVSSKYKTYVEENWNTFDCVVVVMDGRQGVNTECQVSLLQFVKANLESKKNVPVVILCNKIDDQDDEEQAELVLEAQREVEKIFGLSDRQKSLQTLLQACGSAKPESWRSNNKKNRRKKTTRSCDDISPVFIPISGITAFIFQTCSNMSLERFRNFDEKLIAKLGRERIGKFRWKKLSQEEKIKEAHEAVSDPEGYKEGVADSNFDKFLKVLSFLVGGKNVQQKLIEEQVQVALATMSAGPGIVEKLEILHKKVQGLSQGGSEGSTSIADIKSTFWRLYKGMEQDLLAKKGSALNSFLPLADELKSYRTFASTVGWESEANLSVVFLKNAVRRFLDNLDSTRGFAKDLKVVYTAMKESGLEKQEAPSVQLLQETFEKLFVELEKETFAKFTSIDSVQKLSFLAEELLDYDSLIVEAGWTNERSAVAARFKDLVLKQIGTLCELASKCSHPDFGCRVSTSESMSFADFSWLDWKLSLRSILLLRYDRQFCQDFGREMVLIECLLESDRTCEAPMDANEDEQCPNCNKSLSFNRACGSCRVFVSLQGSENSKCFRRNCDGTLSFYNGNGNKFSSHRCNYCGQIQYIQKSATSQKETTKYFCPNCPDQDLDHNRRCGKCRVFFCPHNVPSVCPLDGCTINQATGNCSSCGNIWKKILPIGCVHLQCSGKRLKLSGKQYENALDVPSSLSDPNHFGHLAWKYCEFMATTKDQSGKGADAADPCLKVHSC